MTPLHNTKLLVVKIGTSLMRSAEDQSLRADWLTSLAEDVAVLAKAGTKMVIVSSGAVGFGRPVLGLGDAPLSLAQKQAASAAGQPHLIAAWQEALAVHGLKVGQLLVVLQDSELRRRYLNTRSTLEQLLAHNIIPIVNENDTVATEELRVGDNDRLAARVAAMVGADQLVMLSDVDGLYTKAPHKDGAEHIPHVAQLDAATIAMAEGAGNAAASGGMRTKLDAAQIATQAGCHTMIASGVGMHPLAALRDGAKHTLFTATTTPLLRASSGLRGALNITGNVTLDAGAVNALSGGNSLLPIGITAVDGTFDRGDTIAIYAADGCLIAKGISAYTHDEVAKIMGHQADEIEMILGYNGRDNVVHRDDLVMEQGGITCSSFFSSRHCMSVSWRS